MFAVLFAIKKISLQVIIMMHSLQPIYKVNSFLDQKLQKHAY